MRVSATALSAPSRRAFGDSGCTVHERSCGVVLLRVHRSIVDRYVALNAPQAEPAAAAPAEVGALTAPARASDLIRPRILPSNTASSARTLARIVPIEQTKQ